MTPTKPLEVSKDELDAIAWGFLRSEFTGQVYADWPIDRRLDAYLEHHGIVDVAYNGTAYDLLLDCVMANIGPAFRDGVLGQPN